MASKSFEKVMRAIRSSKSREHGRGASEEELRAAERALFWDHELDEDQTPEEYGEDFSSWLLEQLGEDP